MTTPFQQDVSAVSTASCVLEGDLETRSLSQQRLMGSLQSATVKDEG